MTAPAAPDSGDILVELEAEVREKYAQAWRAAHPEWAAWADAAAEIWASELGAAQESWTAVADVPAIPAVHQFPPERWIVYPHRRMVCLVWAEKAIAVGDFVSAAFLIEFGGKERMS